jgi:hypothetical protein
MSTLFRQYVRMFFGWFLSWIGFAFVYGHVNDVGNTYISTIGLAAPILLIPAFTLLEARLLDSSWDQDNPGKHIGLAWIVGMVGYFPALLIIVGIASVILFVAKL